MVSLGGVAISSAQTTNHPAESPLLRDARQLGDAVVTALNQNDLPAALNFFATNCTVTWCDAELTRGHEGLRAVHQRLLGDPLSRVETYHLEYKADEVITVLPENAGLIWTGGFNESYKRPGGRKLDLQGRWSATLVRQGGDWLILNLQLSTDPFNNSLLNLAKQAGWVVGVVSLLLGAGVGFFLGRRKSAG